MKVQDQRGEPKFTDDTLCGIIYFMTETLRTVQWNIGGGKIKATEPHVPSSSHDYGAEGLYDLDGLETIIDVLGQTQPDIITLQETHEADGISQASDIADALGLKYWVNDQYGESHIDPAYRLGQAIISRFPLSEIDFTLFINPGYKAEWATRTHDKGVSSALAHLGNKTVMLVQTLHAVPFRAFGVDQSSDQAKPVIEDMETKVLAKAQQLRLLQGDFNLHGTSLRSILPRLYEAGFDEVPQAEETTPAGRIYDHVLFSGFKVIERVVNKEVSTDHYPIVTTLAQY